MSPRAYTPTDLLRMASSPRIVKSALQIALVVGTILNLINQGGALFAGKGVAWLHVGLNYLVPYCVASFSAARNQLGQHREP